MVAALTAAVLTRFAGGGAESVVSSDSVLELDCLVLLLEVEKREELAVELDVLLDALDEAEEVLGGTAEVKGSCQLQRGAKS